MYKLPLLSLYIHIPWCVKRCPYCDFNSYTLETKIPHITYVEHLLKDLEKDLPLIANREIHSIFIGGGTPNLLNSYAIQRIIKGINNCLSLSKNVEITIEVNPGIVEHNQFLKYYHMGINRISIGIQTLNKEKLLSLGRIHEVEESIQAISIAQKLDFNSFNVDLIYGLPKQSLNEAINDLKQIIKRNPPHISWYQLTIEPNTLFALNPPELPNDDVIWNIFKQGKNLLIKAGYHQYEISNYAKINHECKHNINYWRFGDYVGIGCGAHSKLTQLDGRIIRTVKTKHPYTFMKGKYVEKQYEVLDVDKPLEFFMNRLRLLEAIPRTDFYDYTGLHEQVIRRELNEAIATGYLLETTNYWLITKKGQLFLNLLLEFFIK
ncbi:radical SAM family heme chaperone HemW [Pantoea sp. Mhis]|uniref:radical SAM family heme chaperone HemW n=1 Tax=Pantoea sp. Mhis TaxID=2576759 RepID=UPI00135A9812|nr:radical SAM family heme chaperone HemW [Pantoea sp. Mhis]MXP56692.1 radical SAM family heme chaperone HemW [Pantoea sp. Mhis]